LEPWACIPLRRASLIAAMNGLTKENDDVLPAASNACRVEKMNAGDPRISIPSISAKLSLSGAMGSAAERCAWAARPRNYK
jgi:hypothetical protein